MGQAAHLEALAVATGDKIKIYSGASYLPTYERSGRVLGLAIYRGALIDCGDYKGIKETLTRKTIVGEKERWRKIAVRLEEDCPPRLFAAKQTDIREKYGITEIVSSQNWGPYTREGPTDVLVFGHGMIWDAGRYPNRSRCSIHRELLSLRDTTHWDRMAASSSINDPVTAALPIPRGFLYTWPNQVIHGQGFDASHRMERLLERKTPLSELAYDLLGTGNEERAVPWKRRITDKAKELSTGELVLDPRTHNHSLLSSIREFDNHKQGFSALAIANGELYVGDRGGKLYVLRNLRSKELLQVAQFDHSIEALCTIPAEIFDGGLRQKIARVTQCRYTHRNNRRAGVRLIKAA